MSATPMLPLDGGHELEEGWQRCLKQQRDPSGEIRYVPSTPLYWMMMLLCFINTFCGTFLVPHCKTLSTFFGKGTLYAAYIVGTPYISNIFAVYMSKHLVRKGWLLATCTNCAFIAVGTACCYCVVVVDSLRNIHILLAAELIYGFGMGCQFIGRQLGVETSSTTARNKIFSQQTTATSLGILMGTSTSGLTTLLGNGTEAWQVGLPFAILSGIACALFLFACVSLPNKIVKVPASEATGIVATASMKSTDSVKTSASVSVMSTWDRKKRIWSTLVVGFNRVVVRSMVENETTAFYQVTYAYPEVFSSTLLALAYIVGIIALQIFGCLHDRITDRNWIYITLAFVLVGTTLQFPIFPDNKMFETIKFTCGICCVLPGLAMNTAVANSTATKYAIKDHWLYSNEMIGLLQILTQTTLARIVGPFAGYVLASKSMQMTLVIQGSVTLLSVLLTYMGVSSNAAETAKGRASLRMETAEAEKLRKAAAMGNEKVAPAALGS